MKNILILSVFLSTMISAYGKQSTAYPFEFAKKGTGTKEGAEKVILFQ